MSENGRCALLVEDEALVAMVAADALNELGFEVIEAASAKVALPRRPLRVVLRPGSGALLERPVDLPLAAEHELDRVIGFELDRLTPFAAVDAIWHAEVMGRDPAQRRLSVRLSLVPRRALAVYLDWMTRANLAPTWLEATAADGALRRIPLSANAHRRLGSKATGAAAVAVAVLTVAALVTPFVVQSFARSATDRAIEALAPRVARIEALRRQQASSAAGADALAAEHARVGACAEVAPGRHGMAAGRERGVLPDRRVRAVGEGVLTGQ